MYMLKDVGRKLWSCSTPNICNTQLLQCAMTSGIESQELGRKYFLAPSVWINKSYTVVWINKSHTVVWINKSYTVERVSSPCSSLLRRVIDITEQRTLGSHSQKCLVFNHSVSCSNSGVLFFLLCLYYFMYCKSVSPERHVNTRCERGPGGQFWSWSCVLWFCLIWPQWAHLLKYSSCSAPLTSLDLQIV